MLSGIQSVAPTDQTNMAPNRKIAGHALAKSFGIDPNYRNESKNEVDPFSDVELFYEDEPTVKELLSRFKPTLAGVVRYFRSLFPFWSWIFHYNFQWLTGDIIAGACPNSRTELVQL